ncbi:hypothetical protein MSNKSG1_11023 [Marinobacter santoriniensis NKSG1]|uniref:SbsA Ig-like domain-containing protein n=1 Tax=Marinobacter santoriniensis NKSG1 TaxID=1288826 RepID=M7DFG2_9GAMM|nr:thrombospondin type 3 repeat-containing protein [Marinobacter santoriniensis]EMP56402.1 hypothetical protein MSNKSG1_11023 [Marinobacter santoriniensis NKSG1]
MVASIPRLLLLALLALVLTACGGGGSDSVDESTDASGASVNSAELPAIRKVTALSRNYIEVRFATDVAPDISGNIFNYTITLSNGHSAPVVASYPGKDGTTVLLEIAPAEEDLQLVPNGTLTLDLVNIDDQPILFTGDGSEEPVIKNAVSLSDTQVFLEFNEPVSDSAGKIKSYQLSSESGQPLKIVAAAMGPQANTVMLTTEPQSDEYYNLEVTGVTGLVSGLPLLMSASASTFLGASLESAKAEAPSVVSAASLDNTRVLVVFNKAMSDQTVAPSNFSIVQENVNPEAGALLVVSARFASADRQAVELTTRSQNELTYEVTVTNATDMYGQQLKVSSGTTVTLTANTATFAGTPPRAEELVDTDGDGLYDNEEQAGYTVIIELANGDIVSRQVTSDPDRADTDGDGLSDSVELQYGMNPRVTDTDGDGLGDNLELNTIFSNPFAQDSDSDGLQDGFEHFDLKTSPILADTDGDQLSDYQELFELNRDPRVADLPEVSINVGDVRLQIDERYSYTDESGQLVTQESSTSSTLSQSENKSFSRSDNGTSEWAVGLSVRTGGGGGSFFGGEDSYTGGFEATASGSYASSSGWQTDRSSARESQQAYEQSLAKGQELSTTQSVTREVVGASIEVPVTITNDGSVPLTLSNLEITVLQQVGSQDKFLPVATLVSNSELTTGTPLTINLGGSFTERGPFVFSSREVFPNLVEALLRNPSALVFRVANYDVADELGRNFSFISQAARDRTASITLDFGDAAAAKNYLVATNGILTEDSQYLGGFSSSGRALGVPLAYLLEADLGLPRHQTAQDTVAAGYNGALESVAAGDDVLDVEANVIRAGANGWLETVPAGDDYVANPTGVSGIIAGLNKTADSIAQGDDIQLVPLNSNGLSLGTVIIGPGENGVLDTPAQGDDTVDFIGGYETSRTCSAFSANAGDVCRVDGDCQTGTCTGPQKLVRVKSLRNGDFNRAWVILTTGQVPDAADFDQVNVEPGNNLSLAFLQDLDGDGLFARNEFLYGSTDSDRDQLDNGTFGPGFASASQNCNSAKNCDGKPDSMDSDQDGLSDFAEVFVGWKVAVDGGALRQTFSSPRFRDTDGDGLDDIAEQDLREFCASGDARSQGLCAFQNEAPVEQADAIGIIAGKDKTASTTAMGDDEQLTPVATSGLAFGTPVVGPGPNGIMDSALAGDDVYEGASNIPPATDPTEPDTDRDNISDYAELNGFDAKLAIVDGGNGLAESARNGDDVQRVFINNPVSGAGVIILPGDNRIIDSPAGGDDYLRPAVTVETDPLRRDTDDDSVADGNERIRGSDPTVDDVADFSDMDQDGLTDAEESLGWLVPVVGGTAYPVNSSPSLPDTDFDGLPDFVERDLRTDPNKADTDGDGIGDYEEVADLSKYLTIAALYPNMNITSANTGGYGTDPTKADTDKDNLTDYQELIEGFRLSLPGDTLPTTVFTNPLFADTDLDGLEDGDERSRNTDPNNADTDGDGRKDGAEIQVGTNPLIPDVAFQIVLRDVITNDQCTDGGTNGGDSYAGEVLWWVVVDDPQTGGRTLLSDALDAEFFQGADEDLGAIFALDSAFDFDGDGTKETTFSFRDRVPGSFPLGSSPRACYYTRHWSQSSWLPLNKRSKVYTMVPGDSFGLQAQFVEQDGFISADCGVAPSYIPTVIDGKELNKIVRKRYSYSDLVNSSGVISLVSSDAMDVVNSGTCTIDFQIDIDVIGEAGPKPVGLRSP